MEQTSNYHLNKPAISEKIDINLLNQNMDIIDRELNNETNSFSSVSGNLNSHIENKTNPHNVTKKQLELENVENKSSSTIRGEITKDNVTNALGYTPYTPNEIDNKFSALETKIDWKEAVDTYEDIASTYPSPEDGWTVNVKDTDYTYRYNGEKWVAISANAIPKATSAIDGILSKEDYSNFNDANSQKHTHNNMSVLNNITTTSVGSWVKAAEHVLDDERHISLEEKEKLRNIPSDAEKNVQVDWNVEDETSDAYIRNKPKISDIINPDDFVKKAGDTMTGQLTVNNDIQLNGTEYVGRIGWNSSGIRDNGYDVIADIQVTASYTDSPLVFEVVRRHAPMPMEISVTFAAASNNDPSLQSLTYQGTNYDAKIWKTDTSKWRLVVKRNETADEMLITRFIKQTTGGANIVWTKKLITELPEGVTTATLGGQVAAEINSLKNSVKTVVYQSAEPTSGLVDNLVWIG